MIYIHITIHYHTPAFDPFEGGDPKKPQVAILGAPILMKITDL